MLDRFPAQAEGPLSAELESSSLHRAGGSEPMSQTLKWKFPLLQPDVTDGKSQSKGQTPPWTFLTSASLDV